MAKVNFKRIQNSSQIDNLPVEDGSFIVTGDGKTYVDYGTSRIPTSGTPDSTMSDSSRNTVENKVVKEYVDGEISSLKPILLWENSSPYSAFASTTIELSSSDYDFLEIYYNNYNNDGFKQLHCIKIPKGYNGMMNANFVNQNYIYVSMRAVTYTDATHLLIHSGLGRWLNGQSWTTETQNNTCIPFRVYGYKYS